MSSEGGPQGEGPVQSTGWAIWDKARAEGRKVVVYHPDDWVNVNWPRQIARPALLPSKYCPRGTVYLLDPAEVQVVGDWSFAW